MAHVIYGKNCIQVQILNDENLQKPTFSGTTSSMDESLQVAMTGYSQFLPM